MADAPLSMRYQALASRFGGIDGLIESVLWALNHHGDREMTFTVGWDGPLSEATRACQKWKPPRDAVLVSVVLTLTVVGTGDSIITIAKNGTAILTVTLVTDEDGAIVYPEYAEEMIFLADTDAITAEITTAGADADGLGVMCRFRDTYVAP